MRCDLGKHRSGVCYRGDVVVECIVMKGWEECWSVALSLR